jgi:Flp pilus assembly protein TadD
VRCIVACLLVLLAACGTRGSPLLRSGEPSIDVAQAALKSGSPDIALQITNTILEKDPGNETALVTQGDALTTLGRLDEAAASFTRILQRNPASVDARIGLGRIRLGSDPAAAEVLFLEALQHEPRNAVALNDLGIARDLQRRHADAQTAYARALAANPGMSAAQVNMALSLAMSGRSRDAIQLLRPLASDPGAPRKLRHNLAAVLVMGGDKAEAERILSKDMPPEEVRQAVEAYAAAASPATAATLLAPSDSSTASAAPAASR